jgi:hypothetical protein
MAFLTGQRLTADLLNQNLQGITGTAVVDSASITTTETTVLTATLSMTSGQAYGIWVKATISATVLGAIGSNLANVRVREDSTTGTVITSDIFAPLSTAPAGYPFSTYVEYTAVSTANKTVVFTIQRNTATTEAYQLRAAATRPGMLRVQPIVN